MTPDEFKRSHDLQAHHHDRMGQHELPWPSCPRCLVVGVEFLDSHGLYRLVPEGQRQRYEQLIASQEDITPVTQLTLAGEPG